MIRLVITAGAPFKAPEPDIIIKKPVRQVKNIQIEKTPPPRKAPPKKAPSRKVAPPTVKKGGKV